MSHPRDAEFFLLDVAILRHVATLMIVCGLALGICGCGKAKRELSAVQGRVTLDGQPAEGIEIRLVLNKAGDEAEAVAFAISNSQGEFQLQTQDADGAHPGVAIGSHRLTLNDALAQPPTVSDPRAEYSEVPDPKTMKSRLPPIYSGLSTTPLNSVEVPKGGQELLIEVDSRKKAATVAFKPVAS